MRARTFCLEWLLLFVALAVSLIPAASAAEPLRTEELAKKVSLRDANLTPSFKHRIVFDLYGMDDPEVMEDLLDQSTVSVVGLGPALPKVLRVDGGGRSCGATGNCAVLFYDSESKRLLLKGGGYGVHLLPAMHHDAHDVIARWNLSCCDGTVKLYRFDGTRYRLAWTHWYKTE